MNVQQAAYQERVEKIRVLFEKHGGIRKKIREESGSIASSSLDRILKTIRDQDKIQARPAVDLPLHLPTPTSESILLPDPVELKYTPFVVSTPGTWLVIGDIHMPFHDKKTIELAVDEARRRSVVGVVLNGDILDCAEVSEHDRDPDSLELVDEIEMGKQFLAWLRSKLRGARIIYKCGNHDDRIPRYVMRRAPALFKLAGNSLEHWIKAADQGVEWVRDKRVIMLGKLNVIHGHEYRGGAGSAVNPARGIYLKARSVVIVGHHHRTSEHHARNIRDNHEAAWSVGCACFLSPAWLPLNDWNHGFAFVTVDGAGDFIVENKRVLGGKVV